MPDHYDEDKTVEFPSLSPSQPDQKPTKQAVPRYIIALYGISGLLVLMIVAGLLVLGTSLSIGNAFLACLVLLGLTVLWTWKSTAMQKRRMPTPEQMTIPVLNSRVSGREVDGLRFLFHDDKKDSDALNMPVIKDTILLVTHTSRALLYGPIAFVVTATAGIVTVLTRLPSLKISSHGLEVPLAIGLAAACFVLYLSSQSKGSINRVSMSATVIVIVLAAIFLLAHNAADGPTTKRHTSVELTAGWQIYILVVAIAAVACLVIWVRWSSFYFIITDKQAMLVHKYPAVLFIIPPRQLRMFLIHTGTLGNSYTFVGRQFNYGSIDADSGDERDKPFNDIRGIADPDKVVNIIVMATMNARGMLGGLS